MAKLRSSSAREIENWIFYVAECIFPLLRQVSITSGESEEGRRIEGPLYKKKLPFRDTALFPKELLKKV